MPTTAVVVTTAREFLNTVRAGVELLPDLVAAYDRDPAAFDDCVDRLDSLESQCDALAAKLRRDIGRSLEPDFTDLYLLAGDVLLTVSTADAIVSGAERFAKELQALSPALDDGGRADLLAMADATVEATGLFVDGFEAYLSGGDETGADDNLGPEALERVRKLEREADRHKYDLLAREFADARAENRLAEALVLREVVVLLDAVPNAVEDAADRLVSLRSQALDTG